MAHEVEEMFSVRVTPWHGLGLVIEDAPTAEDALVAAGLDWRVIQAPILNSVNGTPITGYKANIRDKDDKVLGIVSDKYKVVQNVEAFAFIDYLLGEGVRFETAGSLFGGKKIWAMAKLPSDIKVGNDKIAPYIAFINTHDGSGAIKVIMTPTRIVCNNTLNFALRDASRSWSTSHIGDVNSKLNEAQKTLLMAENYMKNFVLENERLNNIRLYNDQIISIVESIFPTPDEAGEITVRNIEKLRDDVIFRFNNAPDLKNLNNTAYKLINAVSDSVTHNKPLRNTPTFRENLLDKTLGGHPVIDKAYEIILKAVA